MVVSPPGAATAPDRATLARMDGVIREGMAYLAMYLSHGVAANGQRVVSRRDRPDSAAGRSMTASPSSAAGGAGVPSLEMPR